MFRLAWYFYVFFALIAIYVWVSYFAYLYKEKGKKGVLIAGFSLFITIVSMVIMYKFFTTKKAKMPPRHNTAMHTIFSKAVL